MTDEVCSREGTSDRVHTFIARERASNEMRKTVVESLLSWRVDSRVLLYGRIQWGSQAAHRADYSSSPKMLVPVQSDESRWKKEARIARWVAGRLIACLAVSDRYHAQRLVRTSDLSSGWDLELGLGKEGVSSTDRGACVLCLARAPDFTLDPQAGCFIDAQVERVAVDVEVEEVEEVEEEGEEKALWSMAWGRRWWQPFCLEGPRAKYVRYLYRRTIDY